MPSLLSIDFIPNAPSISTVLDIRSLSLPLACAHPVILPPFPIAIIAAEGVIISDACVRSRISEPAINISIAFFNPIISSTSFFLTVTPCILEKRVAIGIKLSSAHTSMSEGVQTSHGPSCISPLSIPIFFPDIEHIFLVSPQYPSLTCTPFILSEISFGKWGDAKAMAVKPWLVPLQSIVASLELILPEIVLGTELLLISHPS